MNEGKGNEWGSIQDRLEAAVVVTFFFFFSIEFRRDMLQVCFLGFAATGG